MPESDRCLQGERGWFGQQVMEEAQQVCGADGRNGPRVDAASRDDSSPVV